MWMRCGQSTRQEVKGDTVSISRKQEEKRNFTGDCPDVVHDLDQIYTVIEIVGCEASSRSL